MLSVVVMLHLIELVEVPRRPPSLKGTSDRRLLMMTMHTDPKRTMDHRFITECPMDIERIATMVTSRQDTAAVLGNVIETGKSVVKIVRDRVKSVTERRRTVSGVQSHG